MLLVIIRLTTNSLKCWSLGRAGGVKGLAEGHLGSEMLLFNRIYPGNSSILLEHIEFLFVWAPQILIASVVLKVSFVQLIWPECYFNVHLWKITKC